MLAKIAQFFDTNPIKSLAEPANCSIPTKTLKFSRPYRLNSNTIKFVNKQLSPKKRKDNPENTIIPFVSQK